MPVDLARTILDAAGNKAQIILRLADLTAQNRLQSGATWANAVQNIGQLPGRALDEYQQRKRQGVQDDLAQMELDAAKTARARAGKLQQLATQYPDPLDLSKALRVSGMPDMADQVLKSYQERTTADLDQVSKTLKVQGDAIDRAMGLFDGVTDQASFDRARAALSDVLPPQVLTHVQQQVGDTYDPARLMQVAGLGLDSQQRLAKQQAALQAAAQRMTTAKTEEDLRQAQFEHAAQILSATDSDEEYQGYLAMIKHNAPALGASFPAAWSKELPAKLERMATAVKDRQGSTQLKDVLINGRRAFALFDPKLRVLTDFDGNVIPDAEPIPPASQSGSQPGDVAFTPDALEYEATKYRILGPAGMMTRLDDNDKKRISNITAQQIKSLGQTPAAAIQKQFAMKSDAASLTQMTKLQESTRAFEQRALAAMPTIQDLSKKVPRTDSPLLNSWWLAYKEQVVGDSPAHQLYNAIETFSAEYAKIMTGSTGSAAGSTDAARAAAKRLIDASLSDKTLRDTLDLMKREMSWTMDGYGVSIQSITDRMGGGQTSPAPASGGPTEGARAPVPGHPGVMAVYRGGRWVVE